jgi:ADP-dependent NAD(P)H-hydrate dehydratase / NAD(P)H-hydrate epimerase
MRYDGRGAGESMIPVLTAGQMREADRRTIEEIGVPGAVLMENAGTAVARLIEERFPAVRRPVVLCGRGNNGGDGFVVARRLAALRPTIYLMGARDGVKGDARVHLGALEGSGALPIVEVVDENAWCGVRERLWEADLIVDALLGTGLAQEPTGLMRQVIEDVVALTAPRGVPIVAVDLPSGLTSDSGDVAWLTLSATLTVAFGAPKCGHVLPPACDRVGELAVVDIGIPRELLENGARLWLLDPSDAVRALPTRASGSHKGDFGHLLIIAGSVGKAGAATLAATAALRAGVGLVTVATPEPALATIASARAEVMTEPLDATPSGAVAQSAVERALALARERDAVVIGPGLGQNRETRAFVREFVRQCPTPLLIDADGINAVASGEGVVGASELLRRERPTIVTPHPGEMARLVGRTTGEVQRHRLEVVRSLAVESGAVVVLKGQRTIVADGSGRSAVNPTGNPGMASGGTGDVLAGMAGAILARHHDAWLAATAAVYLHGLAGDIAARSVGQDSLIAGDVIESLPEAIASLTGRGAD